MTTRIPTTNPDARISDLGELRRFIATLEKYTDETTVYICCGSGGDLYHLGATMVDDPAAPIQFVLFDVRTWMREGLDTPNAIQFTRKEELES